ncbi:MAG: thiamine phosphate synthase [Acidobacteriia bacterium]|nr:thiamine phosphate synthase [Terriglobia bacterium]
MPLTPKPVFCYVTDRRSLERAPSSAGSSVTGSFGELLKTIRNAAASGAAWIQIREKDLEAREFAELTRLAMEAAKGTAARIIVNGRLDVALAANAAGVHLGENSLPLEAVAGWRRSSGRMDFLIGASCHSLDAARAAERSGADYIFFGPVFVTPSKAAFGPPQGIERLREVCAAVKIPVLAIGGIDLGNARVCLDAGAAGFAAIRLFQGEGKVRLA